MQGVRLQILSQGSYAMIGLVGNRRQRRTSLTLGSSIAQARTDMLKRQDLTDADGS